MIESEMVNGWRNRSTWNIALWIENDEPLYLSALDYKSRCAVKKIRPSYYGFVKYASLIGERTPDGYLYDSAKLDYRALSEMIREL